MTATPVAAHAEREPTYRRNFVFFLLDNVLFNLAMGIIGPTTVIPDFIRHLTNSEVVIGLASNLFDIGSTLPQLLMARTLMRVKRMKWWFILPNIPARIIFLGLTAAIVALGAGNPSGILLAFLLCYGIAALGNGITNVPVWILLGSSLDARWRARMIGLTSAIVGLLMLGITPLIGQVLGASGLGFPNNYAVLFGAAAVLFAINIVPVVFVHEYPNDVVENSAPPLSKFLPRLVDSLRDDFTFRAIVVARTLTSLFAMAGPFYIGFATVQLGLSSTVAVPGLLAMQTLGSLSGALLYTYMGAQHNLRYVRLSLSAAALVPLCALAAIALGPIPLYVGFLIAGFTVNHVLDNYQNMVITHAAPEQRAMYAGLFNTLNTVTLFVGPVLAGTLVQELGYSALFVVSLCMLVGALYVVMRHISDAR